MYGSLDSYDILGIGVLDMSKRDGVGIIVKHSISVSHKHVSKNVNFGSSNIKATSIVAG